MKILAIGATNNTESINKQLATYTAGLNYRIGGGDSRPERL